MSDIHVITAADANFKEYVYKCADSSKTLGYKTTIYDLGGLDTGKPFTGRVSDNIGAKIPCKPSIIYDAMKNIPKNDYVVWIDADVIVWDRFDEITMQNFDIGVTGRNPKDKENDLPINAGVVFVRNSIRAENFVKQWINQCETAVSDQVELNKLCHVSSSDIGTTVTRHNTNIHVFPCDIYNNFYFKKPQMHAKLIHYKSKHRFRWPERTIKKIPKGTVDRSQYVQVK